MIIFGCDYMKEVQFVFEKFGVDSCWTAFFLIVRSLAFFLNSVWQKRSLCVQCIRKMSIFCNACIVNNTFKIFALTHLLVSLLSYYCSLQLNNGEEEVKGKARNQEANGQAWYSLQLPFLQPWLQCWMHDVSTCVEFSFLCNLYTLFGKTS